MPSRIYLRRSAMAPLSSNWRIGSREGFDIPIRMVVPSFDGRTHIDESGALFLLITAFRSSNVCLQ